MEGVQKSDEKKSVKAPNFIEKMLPKIVEEVETTGAPAPMQAAKKESLPVRSATRRKSDAANLEKDISEYFQSIIALRDRYANRLYFLLFFEIVMMFTFVALHGLELIKLESWLVTIVAETILVKTFLTVQTIVKNLFPNKNLLEMIIARSDN